MVVPSIAISLINPCMAWETTDPIKRWQPDTNIGADYTVESDDHSSPMLRDRGFLQGPTVDVIIT